MWVRSRYGAVAYRDVEKFVALVSEENARQNLVSPASVATIWNRHVVDSAQLLTHRKPPEAGGSRWLDIGTGGGFPGMVVAILLSGEVVMIEPRRRRAQFLRECSVSLGIAVRATVIEQPVERIAITADTISARAVASIEKLLQAAAHCATSTTRWLLPRGRMRDGELDGMSDRYGMVFHVEQSITDAESMIVIAERR